MPAAKPTYFSPSRNPAFAPTYSQISSIPISPTSTLISIAGQIGYDAATQTVPPTLAEQVALACANVDTCLEAAGATKADIVQVRQYVVDLLRGGVGQDPEGPRVYAEWLGGLKPPSTRVGVQALAREELLYEIEVICVVNRDT
ncbi:hypothetical protein DPSP01_014595 [Paraphaeosphaeria sporulosa]|uniref:YjgF-like protein n=1 Tax=Paraphaeosphaeria sporulosa TaxID=1460663 RepID=A0A177CG35_9PLEO|nr:YjgF-like protein [Paraphaeosphaeria sporulosa]OAG06191.1 YjgF-like protein [Paraphaeosphaeria sporulosa]